MTVKEINITKEERDVLKLFIKRSSIFPSLKIVEKDVNEDEKLLLRFSEEMTYPGLEKDVLARNEIHMKFYDEEKTFYPHIPPWGFLKALMHDHESYGLGLWRVGRLFGEKRRKKGDTRFTDFDCPRENKENYYLLVEIQPDGSKPHIHVTVDEKNQMDPESTDPRWVERMAEKEKYELVLRVYFLEYIKFLDRYENIHNSFILGNDMEMYKLKNYLDDTKQFLTEISFYLQILYYCYRKVTKFQYHCLKEIISIHIKMIEEALEKIETHRTNKKIDITDPNFKYNVMDFYENGGGDNVFVKIKDFMNSFLTPRKMNIKDEKDILTLLTDYSKFTNQSGYLSILIEEDEVLICPSFYEVLRTYNLTGKSMTNEFQQHTQMKEIKEFILNKPYTIVSKEENTKLIRDLRIHWDSVKNKPDEIEDEPEEKKEDAAPQLEDNEE
ncbi:hypothetical protein [Bacillus sp. FSL W8-0519]|uniref:hypothetical protein n=1 Tax=Bacillus sp. FSL W8-0519 TaxID=2954624 RepID=UPI0002F17051